MDAGEADAGQAVPHGEPREASLVDEVSALIEDSKLYAKAELAFQKTRLAFVGQHVKQAAILGGVAAVLVVLAIVVLAVGLLFALIPLIGPWGATGVVFVGFLAAAFVFARLASAKWSAMLDALDMGSEEK